MADLVDDLFADAVLEDVGGALIREAAVARGLQPVGGDDAPAAVEVGQSEDVVAPSVEEVVRGDRDVFGCRGRPVRRVE